MTANNYFVVVYAEPVGATVACTVSGYIPYPIQPAPLTGVTLAAAPTSPQMTGTAITLTATPHGGMVYPNVQYQFVAQYQLAGGTWAPTMLLQDWSTSSSCTWTPTTADTYNLTVYARPVGGTASATVMTSLTFVVQPPVLSGVTLAVTPVSPQVTGTMLTLTATPQGGMVYPNVQYQFVAQYRNPDGTWAPNILIQDWGTSNQSTWTPTTSEPYYLNVYARPVGSTALYTVTTYLPYTIQPANLTGVTLSASSAAPQVTGTTITLTASPLGGITYPNVEYQFVAQYNNADGTWAPNILIQDWSTSNQCTWTPVSAENYYLVVYVRPVGSTVAYAVTTYIPYAILPANLTGVTLAPPRLHRSIRARCLPSPPRCRGASQRRTFSISSMPNTKMRTAPGRRIS